MLHLLEELKDKAFLFPAITKIINKRSKVHTLTDGQITVHFYKIPISEMKTYIRRAALLHSYLNVEKHLTIWVVPVPLPRVLPAPEEPITEEHINGGYTYLNRNDIFIYRQEDYPKVMLHEVIHHSHINSTSPYNEAIVEFWALLFHLLFISTHNFDELYEEELNWNLSLCKKLQQHKGDTSHAYNYIFIKTCLLFFRKEFLATKNQDKFIQQHKKHPAFLKAIQNAKTISQDSLRMVKHGNL